MRDKRWRHTHLSQSYQKGILGILTVTEKATNEAQVSGGTIFLVRSKLRIYSLNENPCNTESF